jgi:hypothetical protein
MPEQYYIWADGRAEPVAHKAAPTPAVARLYGRGPTPVKVSYRERWHRVLAHRRGAKTRTYILHRGAPLGVTLGWVGLTRAELLGKMPAHLTFARYVRTHLSDDAAEIGASAYAWRELEAVLKRLAPQAHRQASVIAANLAPRAYRAAYRSEIYYTWQETCQAYAPVEEP